MAQIPVRISPRNHINKQNRRCSRNLIPVKISKPGPPISKAVPKCLIINARSLVKPDAPSALNMELNSIILMFALYLKLGLILIFHLTLYVLMATTFLRIDRSDSRKGGGVAIL